MTKAENCEDLGFGIFRYSGVETESLEASGLERFLDELWLPCSLSELSEEQIFVINRHRESAIGADTRYETAQRSRARLANLANATNGEFVVEIGCGKFPIGLPTDSYLGVDIDPEAIRLMRSKGYSVCLPSELSESCPKGVGTIVSSFAMHFKVEESLLDNLSSLSKPNGIIAFSLIIDNSLHLIELINNISKRWPILQIVKTSIMTRREYLIIMGKENAMDRVLTASVSARTFDSVG